MGLSDLSSDRANDSLLNNRVMVQCADHNYENGNWSTAHCAITQNVHHTGT